jgi:hypothetical protein
MTPSSNAVESWLADVWGRISQSLLRPVTLGRRTWKPYGGTGTTWRELPFPGSEPVEVPRPETTRWWPGQDPSRRGPDLEQSRLERVGWPYWELSTLYGIGCHGTCQAI